MAHEKHVERFHNGQDLIAQSLHEARKDGFLDGKSAEIICDYDDMTIAFWKFHKLSVQFEANHMDGGGITTKSGKT